MSKQTKHFQRDEQIKELLKEKQSSDSKSVEGMSSFFDDIKSFFQHQQGDIEKKIQVWKFHSITLYNL